MSDTTITPNRMTFAVWAHKRIEVIVRKRDGVWELELAHSNGTSHIIIPFVDDPPDMPPSLVEFTALTWIHRIGSAIAELIDEAFDDNDGRVEFSRVVGPRKAPLTIPLRDPDSSSPPSRG